MFSACLSRCGKKISQADSGRNRTCTTSWLLDRRYTTRPWRLPDGYGWFDSDNSSRYITALIYQLTALIYQYLSINWSINAVPAAMVWRLSSNQEVVGSIPTRVRLSYFSDSGSNMHWTFGVYLCWAKAKIIQYEHEFGGILVGTSAVQSCSWAVSPNSNTHSHPLYQILLAVQLISRSMLH